MVSIPENVKEKWDDRNGSVILSTVSSKGVPNSIYATCVSMYDDSTILIADNYFNKTKRNLVENDRGSILFITKSLKAIQLKGQIEYKTEGQYFEDMKTWNPKKHPGKGVAIFRITEIFSGSEKLA